MPALLDESHTLRDLHNPFIYAHLFSRDNSRNYSSFLLYEEIIDGFKE
ncbi:hypothetical protein [Dapis sp. BLCC M229]